MNKDDLINFLDNGNISYEDALMMVHEMNVKKVLSNYTLPQKPSSDGWYHIWIKDKSKKSGRRQIKRKTLEELKLAIYEHELEPSKDTCITFKETFDRYQDDYLSKVKGDKRYSRENTVNKHRSDYKRFFFDTFFENMPMTEIRKRDVEEICMFNLKRYDLKKKAFNEGLCGILRQTFDYAYKEEWIESNIIDRVDFKQYKDMLFESTPVSERAFTETELDSLKDFLHKKQKKNRAYLVSYALEMQLITGLRRGEIPPLLWSDIDDNFLNITKEQLTVKKSSINPKEYDKIVSHTKTDRARKFPLTSELRELLKRLKNAHEMLGLSSEYLFPADTDTGVISNNTVYNLFRRCCKSLDITIDKNFIKGTHSFRRNIISKAVNKSGNIELTASVMGNSPQTIRKNYYLGADYEEALSIFS